jgi:hypothetical protein
LNCEAIPLERAVVGNDNSSQRGWQEALEVTFVAVALLESRSLRPA